MNPRLRGSSAGGAPLPESDGSPVSSQLLGKHTGGKGEGLAAAAAAITIQKRAFRYCVGYTFHTTTAGAVPTIPPTITTTTTATSTTSTTSTTTTTYAAAILLRKHAIIFIVVAHMTIVGFVDHNRTRMVQIGIIACKLAIISQVGLAVNLRRWWHVKNVKQDTQPTFSAAAAQLGRRTLVQRNQRDRSAGPSVHKT
jgi:hypothetical protein